MEFTVIVSEDRRYIILTGCGELQSTDHEAMLRSLVEVYALAEPFGINRCLVDWRNVHNVQSPFQEYDFIYRRVREEPSIHQRMLFVLLVAPGDHSHDFFSTVSNNAGFVVRTVREPRIALEVLQR